MRFVSSILNRIRGGVVSLVPLVLGAGFGFAIFFSLITYSLAPFFVGGPPAGSPENAFKIALDDAVPTILNRFRVPGAAIATVLGGAPSHVYAYGMADVARGRRMAPGTVLQVASISKSVTAWGVMKLVEAGKVDLDQPAKGYLASWPLARSAFPAEAVTLRGLLTHTAGLNAGEDTFRGPQDPPASAADLLARQGPPVNGTATRARLVAPPGRSFVYSAPGFTLVQMIIEAQSGEPFPAFMKRTVLRPLGMTSSSFDWDMDLRSRTAVPYDADGRPGPVRVPQDMAADALFSTAGDLAEFIAAPLLDDVTPVGAGVLSESSVRQLFLRPSASSSGLFAGIGPEAPCMGCFLERSADGSIMISNSGHDPGWTSMIYMAPSTGDGLVILTNSSRGQPAIAQIAGIWAAWRNLPPPQLTHAYRVLGGYAVSVVALAATFVVTAAWALVSGVLRGVRRTFIHHPISIIKCLAEWTMIGSLIYVWSVMGDVFELLPAFSLAAKVILGVLVLIVLGRTLLPLGPVRATS